MDEWRAGVFGFLAVGFSSPRVCELDESEDCFCLCVSTLRSLRLGEGQFAILHMIRPEVGI